MIRRAETPKDYFATFECFDIGKKLSALDCGYKAEVKKYAEITETTEKKPKKNTRQILIQL